MLDEKISQARDLINLTRNIDDEIITKTKLLTITSGKGGVGKSTFSANLAYFYAMNGYKTIVLDADIGLANMQVLLDIRPSYTLFDYINGKKNLDEIILDTSYPNLYLIAGKSGYQYSKTGSFLFSRLVNEILLKDEFDILIIDTGAGLNDYVKEFLTISPNIVAITSTDPSALTDVYSLLKLLSLEKDELMLCFNHTKTNLIGEKVTDSLTKLAKKNRLKDNFMIKYIGSIPNSIRVSSVARARKLFLREFPNDEVSQRFIEVGKNILRNLK
ncbi:Flagellum site-determining protein YlxH [Aliarcobacter thereius]|uniref:Flagellum site-determining protein YlxH n=1 Tax=Aliarcobacter thereius TaxID=544718 RepID=A0A1C0B953_9BACT|nr:AAA family ATPase [Aliarcobacter thereius]OCM00114.1 Flagellum site-determining protein YlxH [Aliarcobacter thereius]TLS72325.1 MinD/ParA family protein [Aliarcobacter thereius]